MRRERHNFFLCWLFHLTSPCAAYFLDPNWSLPSSRLESQLFSPEFKSHLTGFFFKFQNPQRFRACRHSRPLSHFSIWSFYCDISTQCVHLTNPCTKRKVLSLTKPKGNIYKTKNDNIKKIPPQLYYKSNKQIRILFFMFWLKQKRFQVEKILCKKYCFRMFFKVQFGR